jgi:hypothetical protein
MSTRIARHVIIQAGPTGPVALAASLIALTYREVRKGKGPFQVNYSAHWRKDDDNPALANILKFLSECYPLPCAG